MKYRLTWTAAVRLWYQRATGFDRFAHTCQSTELRRFATAIGPCMGRKRAKTRRRFQVAARSPIEPTNTAATSGRSLDRPTNNIVGNLNLLQPDAGRGELRKDVALIRRAINEGWQPTSDKRTRIRDRVEARALITEDMKELKDMVDLSLKMDKTNLDALRLDAQLMGLIRGRDPLKTAPATTASSTTVNVDQPQQVILNIPVNGRGPNGYANRKFNDDVGVLRG